MKIRKLLISAFILLSGCTPLITTSLDQWITVSPGLQYQELKTDEYHLIIAKVDPKLNEFAIIENPPSPDNLSIKQIHEKSDSLLTFNGIFYTEEYTPTGLLISEQEILNPLNNARLTNGIFLIDQNEPALFNLDAYSKKYSNTAPEFAIQNGPILIDQLGEIMPNLNNEDKASRTAIGINQNDDIIIIILRQTLIENQNAMTLHDFAELLKHSSEISKMKLHSVLNLDGGTSTGIMIDGNYFPEIEKVQNVIITKAR